MFVDHLKKGARLKFPLTTKFSAQKQDVTECSLGVERIAVTIEVSKTYTTACAFIFLPHAPGGVNYYEGSEEVVSGLFTGCVMSTYKVNGKRRVAHVHTGNDGARCCKTYFRDLLNTREYTAAKHFKPYSGDRDFPIAKRMYEESPLNKADFLGVVSPDGTCYSVYLRKMGKCDYIVEDCVQRTPTTHIP